jgi:hypothetical protein
LEFAKSVEPCGPGIEIGSSQMGKALALVVSVFVFFSVCSMVGWIRQAQKAEKREGKRERGKFDYVRRMEEPQLGCEGSHCSERRRGAVKLDELVSFTVWEFICLWRRYPQEMTKRIGSSKILTYT